MGNLCIIPARGGSKRIEKKNIKSFLGKPIISYSIKAATDSKLFEEVMVSTDSKEIANLSMQYGAKVPFYRSELASNDFSTISDVVEEVVKSYKEIGKSFNYICCLFPTAPFAFSEMLKKGYDFLRITNADSVRPIVKFGYPIQRSLKLDSTGQITFFFNEFSKSRSQDLQNAYHDAGMFYWMNQNLLVGQKRFAFEISELECQDIDNVIDWEIAELKYKRLKQ